VAANPRRSAKSFAANFANQREWRKEAEAERREARWGSGAGKSGHAALRRAQSCANRVAAERAAVFVAPSGARDRFGYV
jgi:hypothetical protein